MKIVVDTRVLAPFHYNTFKCAAVSGTLANDGYFLAGLEDRCAMKPHAVLQSILAFQVRNGAHFIWCGTRAGAENTTYHLLRHFLREAQERLKAVIKAHGSAA